MPIDAQERARRRRLVTAHLDAEAAYDLDRIMATFAPNAINSLNEMIAADPATTRLLHIIGGWSTVPGVMSNIRSTQWAEHFTDDELIHEGHLHGKHTGFVPGFPPPTQLEIVVPYITFYRFDEHDLLASEHVRIDLSALYMPLRRNIAEGT